jgi:hypothetical protein
VHAAGFHAVRDSTTTLLSVSKHLSNNIVMNRLLSLL